jgi:hypothetical protein
MAPVRQKLCSRLLSEEPILAILDEGLRLYRRHFARFALIAALWLVPITIVAGLVAAAVSWADDMPATLLRLAGGAALLVPMLIYLIGGLSRAAVAAAEGRSVVLREALAIHPMRVIGMSLFALIYIFFAQMIYASIALFPGIVGIGIFGILLSLEVLPDRFWLLSILISLGGYIGLIVGIGMPYSTLCHILQSWIQESDSWRKSFERSNDLIIKRLPTCFLSSMLLITMSLNIGAIIWLLPLESGFPIAHVVWIVAVITSLTILLPPLPIWMALLYRRDSATHEADLAVRIAEWQRLHVAAVADGDLHVSDFPRTIVELSIQHTHKGTPP